VINKGIELQVGGEFGIGGLFEQNVMFENWNTLVLPALEQVISLPQNQNQPILQAAIVNKSPPNVIKDIVQHFTESVNTTDSLNQFPINIAIREKLPWEDGMKEIVHAFANAQKVSEINVCAKHGLQWENGMSNLFKESVNTTRVHNLKLRDELSGLFPFMLAASGRSGNYDLGSIFHLIKKSSRLVAVQRYETLKRKRGVEESS